MSYRKEEMDHVRDLLARWQADRGGGSKRALKYRDPAGVKVVPLSVSLLVEQVAGLAALSAKTGKARAELVREAVADYLEQHK